MNVFDTKKNSAICVLPWVHQFSPVDGKTAPCCHGDDLQPNESISSLRKQMIQGIQPRACNSCYLKEEESGFSPRINETIDWIKKFGEPDINDPEVQFIDVRYDPTCNLKCKTCGPRDSTLWQKEKNIKILVNHDNKNYLHNVNKNKLKKVYLAGGEPTYIKDYIVFLQELYEINPMCEVIVNTNLKRLPDVWKTIITKFENMTVICSCDATGTLGTYVRYPLEWKEFEKNVAWVSKHSNFLQFNLVASNLTVHKLYETCEWMKKYSKNINLSILNNPRYFTERAVPLNHRKTYLDNIVKLLKFPVSAHLAMNFRSKIKYLHEKYKNNDYESSLHLKLQKEVCEQDNHRSLQLSDVDRFLHSWIYG